MFNLAAIPFKKLPVKQGINLAKAFVVKNHKEILVVTGSFGTFVSIVMAVDGGLKADKVIAAVKIEREESGAEWTRTDTVVTAVPYFIPAGLVWALSIAMIIFAIVQFRSENAALAAAYALSEASNDENIKKLKQLTGFDPKEEKVEVKSDEKITCSPIEDANVNEGERYYIYEPYCGQKFMASPSAIRDAVSQLNFDMSCGHEDTPSLNSLYFELGLEQTRFGANNGWNVDCGFITPHFVAVKKDDEKPYLELSFSPEPSSMFRDY